MNEIAFSSNRQGNLLVQQGRYGEAILYYQHALQVQPDFVDAHYNLGNAFYLQGNLDAAVVSYQRSLELNSDYAEAHNNLGAAFTAQGKFNNAIACYRRALELNPANAEAHNNLGSVLQSQGQLDEAIACFERALQLQPDYPMPYYNLGNAWRDQGRMEQAIASYERSLQLQPGHAEAHNNLGAVLLKSGKHEESIRCFQRSLQLNPSNAEAYNNLGNALQALENRDEAVARFRSALRLRPDFVEAQFNLGNALRDQGMLDQAVDAYERALQLNPSFESAAYNAGSTLWDLGKLPQAIAHFDHVLQLEPDHVDAHVNRALVRLLMGDYAAGWPEYEWRWRSNLMSMPRFTQPLWDGTPLAGRTIYLHAEQGFGDTFQFIRYLPLIKAQGGTTILACQESLVEVLRGCPSVDQLTSLDREPPAFDMHAPLLSLPRLFGTTLENVPAEAPYLLVPADLHAVWRQRLAGHTELKVGLCWQGNPKYKDDRVRSIRLERLAPLAQIPGLRLFSLQTGTGADQLEAVRERWKITDLGLPWLDTAAVVCALDLVVTVDSAIAHLAGALGKPAWLMLPLVPNWRWLMARADSPWYPTIRLFRQKTLGDWTDVINEIAEALRQVAKPLTC